MPRTPTCASGEIRRASQLPSSRSPPMSACSSWCVRDSAAGWRRCVRLHKSKHCCHRPAPHCSRCVSTWRRKSTAWTYCWECSRGLPPGSCKYRATSPLCRVCQPTIGRSRCYADGRMSSPLNGTWQRPMPGSARRSRTIIRRSPWRDCSATKALRPSDLFKAATFQPQGVVGLRWRVFDFGKVSAQVTQARGANAEALARYQQAVLRAAEDVENAFTSLVQMEAHREELLIEVAALRRARDASQEAYQGGVIAWTDVLDADRQLLTSQDDLAQTRADSARAAVGTFRALGGGW